MAVLTAGPRCPRCGHYLVSDGADGLICGKRGGCGDEWSVESVERNPEDFGLPPHPDR